MVITIYPSGLSNMPDLSTTEGNLSITSGGEPEATPRSLWNWLTKEANANPEGIALIATHQAADHLSNLVSQPQPQIENHLSWSYNQLLGAVEKLAASFTKHELVASDTVFAFVDNSNAAEWTLLFWTAMRLSATFVPLDPATLRRSDELQSLIKSLRPSLVLVQDIAQAAKFDAIPGAQSKTKLLCCENKDEEGGTAAWRSLASLTESNRGSSLPLPQDHIDPESPVLIMCTSGSTNIPKGCPVSVRGFVAQTRQYQSLHQSNFSPKTRHLMTATVFRPGCYLSCINTWSAGGTAIFYGKGFNPQSIFATLRNLHITHAWIMPAMINLLYEYHSSCSSSSQGELQAASERLKFILSSSDIIDREIVHKATTLFPPTRTTFFPTFGMSEGAPLFGFVHEEDEVHTFHRESGIVGVGRALPGTRAKICSQSDEALRRGERGALHISSIALISHYLDNRSESDFYTDGSGRRWFKTGDEAIVDSTGVIYVVGRTKDTIIHNGQNILPIVSEGCLMEGFSVDAVVVGLKHKLVGSVAAAVVKDVLDDAKKKQMADYMLEKQGPDRGLDGGVWSLRDLGMEHWPVNASGKIQKSVLVDALMKRSNI